MKLGNKLRGRAAAWPLLVGLGLGATLGMAAAAVVYVAADRLDIVEKKRAVAKVVTTVERNAPLTVVAKEGAWYKVEVGGKQGYVFERAVSSSPGAKAGKGIALSKVKPEPVAELENAAAVRGLGEGTRQYAAASGFDTDGIEELFRRSSTITPAEFDKFMAAGGFEPVAAGKAEPADRSPIAAK